MASNKVRNVGRAQRTMRESAIERSCCAWLTRQGCLCIKLTTMKGIPDRLIIPNHRNAFFIEFKAEKGVLSEHQKAFSVMLNGRGHTVLVVRSLAELKDQCAKLL